MSKNKPMMNGASARLSKMREVQEQCQIDLQVAIAALAVARDLVANERQLAKLHPPTWPLVKIEHALVLSDERLYKAYEKLEDASLQMRHAETMAMPETWRFLAGADPNFIVEFLNRVDLKLLTLGLADCRPEVRAAIAEALGNEPKGE